MVTSNFMKKFCILMSVLISFGMFSACSNDDDMNKTNEIPTNETSTNPNERIVGSWLLIKDNEVDISFQTIIWTIMADGTWSVYNPMTTSFMESDSQDQLDIKQLISFEDDWEYDAEKDVISGYLALSSPSVISRYPYRFELKRKELMISFEPRGVKYFRAPTPEVYYYRRW